MNGVYGRSFRGDAIRRPDGDRVLNTAKIATNTAKIATNFVSQNAIILNIHKPY